MQDPYVYSGTKVLKNKFNVTEQSELDSLVSSVTTKRLSELTANPVPGKLDFGHYQAIHHYLFQDLWDWAGDIRTVVLTKSDAFTDPAEINESAQEIFHSLTTTNKLKGIEKNTFCQRAAIICAALYRLHPFRAGNLLTQQVFMSEAAKRSIYSLDWSRATQEQLNTALQHSLDNDNSNLIDIFLAITLSKSERVKDYHQSNTYINITSDLEDDLAKMEKGDFLKKYPSHEGQYEYLKHTVANKKAAAERAARLASLPVYDSYLDAKGNWKQIQISGPPFPGSGDRPMTDYSANNIIRAAQPFRNGIIRITDKVKDTVGGHQFLPNLFLLNYRNTYNIIGYQFGVFADWCNVFSAGEQGQVFLEYNRPYLFFYQIYFHVEYSHKAVEMCARMYRVQPDFNFGFVEGIKDAKAVSQNKMTIRDVEEKLLPWYQIFY